MQSTLFRKKTRLKRKNRVSARSIEQPLLNITVTKAAKALGVIRKTLSAILNGEAGISPEMAFRLSLAFDTSPESWLN